MDNPIARFRKFMEARGWWNEKEEEELKDKLKKEVMKTFKKHENMQRHEVKTMFDDVYQGDMPWNLVRGIGLLLCQGL